MAKQNVWAWKRQWGSGILAIDADEELSEKLSTSIREVIKTDTKKAGFEFPRLTCFIGRWMKHCGWYPDYQLRLFKKGQGNFNDVTVHERVILEGSCGRLKGDLLHYSDPSLEHYLDKFNRYTTMGAEEAFAAGKRARLGDLTLRPFVSFIKHYISKQGYLDGFEGFILSILSAVAVLVKYAKLRLLERKGYGKRMSKSLPLTFEPGDRILISRTDRLGDLILALPFVETMKLRYPECKIEVLASLYASPILEGNDKIDRIVRVQNDQLIISKPYKKDLLSKLRMAKYKAVVALYPERRICYLFHKAEIPIRIGTMGRFHSFLFNYHLKHSRKANKKHENDYNLDFLQFFRKGDKVTMPKVYTREKEMRNARRIMKEQDIEGKFVVLHPGSGGSAERWPLESFVRLYGQLDEAGIPVIVSGSESEGEMIDAMANKLNIKCKTITGDTDLRTLAAVLSLADVVVANSTGPLHLAVAVGTKVVGMYPSKKIMSPRRWGPLGKFDRVIQPTSDVCTCPAGNCRCMETIEVERVAENVIDTFKMSD